MMRLLWLAALLAMGLSGEAAAQTRTPPYSQVQGSQYGLAVASSTALTAPTGATVAVVTVEGSSVRYTTDGTTTPTATVGEGPFPAGTTLTFNLAVLTAVKFIQVTATATINVEYFK